MEETDLKNPSDTGGESLPEQDRLEKVEMRLLLKVEETESRVGIVRSYYPSMK